MADGTQNAAAEPVAFVDVVGQPIDVMNADGTNVRQLTQNTSPALGEDSNPQWSPDGRTIVFQRNNVRSAEPADGIALWTIDVRNGREFRVTPWALRAGDTPDWSPDGKQILFHDNIDPLAGANANLYTIRPDGSHLHQLTYANDGITQYLGSSFSPDGRWITFGRKPATGGVNADVFIMRTNGTHEQPVTHSALYDSYPDWGPNCGHHH